MSQSLQWRYNGRDGVSNHQPHYCLLNHLFRRRSKKTSKLRVTGLCAGNSPVTGEFPAQKASNAENVSIWWRHHDKYTHGFVVLCPVFRLFNSLAPGRFGCDSKSVIFNLVWLIDIFRSSHDNALWWMPQDLTDDNSTLVQVMAWCRQATSHYLSQCWLSPLSPYGVARPQWVKGFFCNPFPTFFLTVLLATG